MKISYYSSNVLPRVLTSIDDRSPNQLLLWWPNGVFKKENKNFVIFLLLVFFGWYLFIHSGADSWIPNFSIG